MFLKICSFLKLKLSLFAMSQGLRRISEQVLEESQKEVSV